VEHARLSGIPAEAEVRVRPMLPSDWPAVRSIYQEGIATGNATFEAEAPDWAGWDVGHLPECRLVASRGGEVVGWVALTPVSRRPVYRGVADLSVYVAGSARALGVGRVLLDALVECSERAGIWTLQAGIFPENDASLALHSSCGFREVGRHERMGKDPRSGAWRDVVLLERRSAVAGR
jgi:L-amino acid N-acyltransferase YncA